MTPEEVEHDENSWFASVAQELESAAERGEGPAPAQFHILSASRAWDPPAMWRSHGGASHRTRSGSMRRPHQTEPVRYERADQTCADRGSAEGAGAQQARGFRRRASRIPFRE